MDNFDTHKWFKKQYLEEGMSDEEIQAIKRFEELSNDDKLKLAKIQAMMDRERSLREDDDNMTPEEIEDFKLRQAVHRLKHTGRTLDDERKAAGLDEIAFGDAGTDKRTGQVVGEIIELIRSTGVDAYEVIEELGQEFGVAFEFGRD